MECVSFKGEISQSQAHEYIDQLGSAARMKDDVRFIVHAVHNAFRLFSPWSAQHSIRVGMITNRIAEALGFSKYDAGVFGFCSCLHDIGKLGVPSSVLEKPGALDAGEREIIEEHTSHGLNVLDGLKPFDHQVAKNVVMYHHENFDGTGYPERLSDATIPTEVRIVRIADFYDAVFFDRPYRPGLTRERTMNLMRENHQLFDPKMFHIFQQELAAIELA